MYNKLMVVAHPDDEALFGGAELLRESGWKVVCVTNGYNQTRAEEFKKAMNIAGVFSYEIWNFQDEYGDFDRGLLTKDLERVLLEKKLDKIVTHNLKGEYGHPQHKALSQLMHQLVQKNLYVFDKGNMDDDILPLPILQRKLDFLFAYKSQNFVLNDLRKYFILEKITKVN